MLSRKHWRILILVLVLWSFLRVPWGSDLIHGRGAEAMAALVGSFLQPDLSGEVLRIAGTAALRTVAYAVTGLSVAMAFGLILALFTSGVWAPSPLWQRGARRLCGAMRAIHELIWAWFFVAAVGLTPLAAIFAIAIPYGGTLGRIWGDQLQDVPQAPIQALCTCGASRLQVSLYSILPQAVPDMMSYGFYRLECALRSSAVLSFVGLGGLGYQIQLSLADLRFHEAWTFLYVLVLLILCVDRWSQSIRGRLRP